jgi:putative ABC transport system permease protein
VNIDATHFLERILARVIADARVAEAIVGDIEEERPRWRVLHILALMVRLGLRRRPHRAPVPIKRSNPMSTLVQDIRYGVRVLLRQPGFALIVVLTLAIGLAANAAVFALMDGMLFRPVPVADFDRMLQIYSTNVAQGRDRVPISAPDLFDWQARARSLERLTAIEFWQPSLSDMADDPERVVGRRVSTDFFDTLRIRLAAGRTFAAGENKAGFNRVLIVSHRLWQRRWAGSPSLVGSTVSIDREPYTVVGIAPERLDFPAGAEIFAPLIISDADRVNRSRRYLEVFARMKPGVTIEEGRSEMSALAAALAQEHPDTNKGYGVNVMPLSLGMLEEGMPSLMLLLQVVVGLVLLIAGANVANLLLVRGAARHRELALRLAVGASRWRVVRQLIVESLVLAVIGAGLAVPLAAGGVRFMKTFIPPEITRFILGWGEVDIDGRLLGTTVAVGLAMGALFGALPALRASRPDLTDALKEGARGTGGRRRVLEAFVVAQVALALALLVSAGLATRGGITLLTQYDGYDPRGVMSFGVTLPQNAYPDDAARLRFIERVVERVRVLPQVELAAFTNTVPFSEGGSARPVEVEGRAVTNASERPIIDSRSVTADYLNVLRVSVVRGRGLTEADRPGAPLVTVIDENMAARLWAGADPIGQRFRPTHVPDAPWLMVVGIVSNVKHFWFVGYRPTYYVTFAQEPREQAVLAVRVRGEESAIAPAVRQVFRDLDPELALANVHSLLRWRSLRTAGMRFIAGLIASFAGIGLFLSAIGIYGVMAYSVNQRTREIGVRMALGATGGQVMGMTLRSAALLAGIGIAIGLVAAFGLGKLLVASLFGVVQLEPVTFGVFAGVLALVALIAAGVPARRAMRVDPISALRAE